MVAAERLELLKLAEERAGWDLIAGGAKLVTFLSCTLKERQQLQVITKEICAGEFSQ